MIPCPVSDDLDDLRPVNVIQRIEHICVPPTHFHTARVRALSDQLDSSNMARSTSFQPFKRALRMRAPAVGDRQTRLTFRSARAL